MPSGIRGCNQAVGDTGTHAVLTVEVAGAGVQASSPDMMRSYHHRTYLPSQAWENAQYAYADLDDALHTLVD